MCPPVARTFNPQHPCCKARAASGKSFRSVTERPVKTPSSSRFGVTQSTSGNSRSRSSTTPSGSSSSLPELDRKTGSSTTGTRTPLPRSPARKSATAATFAAVASIPIFTPAAGTSSQRQSSVARTTSAATGWAAKTPTVDCTVRLVIQEVPNSPCAPNTIKSAVTPAPEDGSNPAIVRTLCMLFEERHLHYHSSASSPPAFRFMGNGHPWVVEPHEKAIFRYRIPTLFDQKFSHL